MAQRESRQETAPNGDQFAEASSGATRDHVVNSCATLEAALSAILRADGVRVALGYLNARTRFRFTGIYDTRFTALHNVCLFDRENPSLNLSGSMCPLLHRVREMSGEREGVGHTRAILDAVLSCGGVPIRADDGRTIGTLCHSDERPRLLASDERLMLAAVAGLFAAYLGKRRFA